MREHRGASGGMLTCVYPWVPGQALTGAALLWNLYAGKVAESRKHTGNSGNVSNPNPRGLAQSIYIGQKIDGCEAGGTHIFIRDRYME